MSTFTSSMFIPSVISLSQKDVSHPVDYPPKPSEKLQSFLGQYPIVYIFSDVPLRFPTCWTFRSLNRSQTTDPQVAKCPLYVAFNHASPSQIKKMTEIYRDPESIPRGIGEDHGRPHCYLVAM